MKYSILFKVCLLLVTLGLVSCYKQKKAGDYEEDKLSNQYYIFKGTVDEKVGIVIGMYVDSNKVSGYYFYDTSGVNHIITGTITDDKFVFEEKDASGKVVVTFTSHLHDKERLKGVFEDHVNLNSGIFKAKIQELSHDGKSAYIAQINVFKESSYSPSITVPKIILEDNRVAERINKQLDFKTLTGSTREEIAAEVIKSTEHHGMLHGIISSDFAQKYNRENILCLRVANQYLTANHSATVKFYCFDLKTGDPIMGRDLLNPFTIKDLTAMCNTQLQEHIARKVAEIGEEQYAKHAHLYKNHKFSSVNFNNFFIEESTIVFFYDFDFPRDKQDLCPNPELTFSFDEIKQFLNPKGPLRFMFEEKEYQKRRRGAN